MATALILGAGVSGLAAARRLRRDGWEVRVLEADERPGGMLRTVERRGFRVELGPTMVPDTRPLRELCADAGCGDDLVHASRAARQGYLVHRGRLQALPGHPRAMLQTPLLSARGKARLLAEPFQARGPGPRESVAAFFRRRFGAEVADTFAAAMAVGVYGGDSRQLAIGWAGRQLYEAERRHGSLLQGARRFRSRGERHGLVTHRHGLGRLAADLAAGLDVRYGTRALAVERGGAGFRVRAEAGGEPASFEAERLVVALPAAAAAAALAPLGATAAIAALPHAPIATVAVSYRRGQVARTAGGFGFLAPPKERRGVLGCLFTSTQFPHVAPEGSVLLTVAVGGSLRPELVERDDADLTRLVERELTQLLETKARPEVLAVHRWQPGLPQPTPAMAESARDLARLLEATPGLAVLGTWTGGVGVADSVRMGWSV